MYAAKKGDNHRESPEVVRAAKMVWTGASEVTHRALPCTGRRTDLPPWG